MLSNKWLTYPSDHWCARPSHATGGQNLTDLSVEQWRNISAPLLSDGMFDKCSMFDVEYSADMARPDEDTTPVVPCKNGWEYDTSVFQVQCI